MEDSRGGRILQSGRIQLEKSALISKIDVYLDRGSSQINKNSGLRIDFTSPVRMSENCLVELTIPNDFEVHSLDFKSVEAYGRKLHFKVSGQFIEIQGACQQHTILKLGFVKNPSSVRDTKSFKLTIKNDKNEIVAVSRKNLIITKASF